MTWIHHSQSRCSLTKLSHESSRLRICFGQRQWRQWPVGLFLPSLACLFVWSTCHGSVLEAPVYVVLITMHACWVESSCMQLGWEDRLLLPHREWLCVCVLVTVSDSPRLCKQHGWKVSCLCLQIDMISAHCPKPSSNTHTCMCLQTVYCHLFLLIIAFGTYECVELYSKKQFAHPIRDSDCIVVLQPPLEERSPHAEHTTSVYMHKHTQIHSAAAA